MNVSSGVLVGSFRRGVQYIINSFRPITGSDKSRYDKCIVHYFLYTVKRNRIPSEYRVWFVFDFNPLSLSNKFMTVFIYHRKGRILRGQLYSGLQVTNPRIPLIKKYNSNS